jgi:hypothetical protein
MLAVMLVTLAAAQNQDDHLADYARQKKNAKRPEPAPKKVYDNDNLPRQEHISVVGTPRTESAADASQLADANSQPAPSDQPSDSTTTSQTDDKPAAKAENAPETADDRQKANEDWQKKIAERKNALALLQRELDVLQREYRLRAAAMYADAGNRLRNSAQWDKEDKQYKSQVDAKQKAVDGAKQQLADAQEQARRAGVPSKLRE